ncbi:unnamed protein product [Chrysoparadoxa australica]
MKILALLLVAALPAFATAFLYPCPHQVLPRAPPKVLKAGVSPPMGNGEHRPGIRARVDLKTSDQTLEEAEQDMLLYHEVNPVLHAEDQGRIDNLNLERSEMIRELEVHESEEMATEFAAGFTLILAAAVAWQLMH